jgi:DNA modification methylase
MTVVEFPDGYAILGDGTSPTTVSQAMAWVGDGQFIVHTDPPYGGILKEDWDRQFPEVQHAAWMLDWTVLWTDHLPIGGTAYVWGGVGTYRNRPFFRYLCDVEFRASVKIQNFITWGKKRGIGTAYNYLFTREELAFMVKGGKNAKPSVFNVPLLDELRGYEGYNKQYPAKSAYKRRTNVWTDITEKLRNKVHVAEKPVSLCKVPIGASTNPGHWVIDPFAGSGATALAARELGRRFIVVENDPEAFAVLVKRLGK